MRRLVPSTMAAALVLTTVSVLSPVTAQAAGLTELIVNVPAPASASASISVRSSDAAASLVPHAFGNDYGSFAVAEIPATTTEVQVSWGSLSASTIALRGSREIWLAADGSAHATRAAAQGGILMVYVRTSDVSVLTLSVGGTSTLQRDPASTATEAVFRVPVNDDSKKVTLQPLVAGQAQGQVRSVDVTRFGAAWLSTAWAGVRTTRAWADGFAVIHYSRPDNTYTDFILHTWNNSRGGADDPGWAIGRKPEPSLTDAWGIAWKVPLLPDSTNLPYIIHKGDEKDLPKDQFLDLELTGGEVWFRSASADEEGNAAYTAPAVISIDADLTLAKAHWVDARTIAWPYPVAAGGRLHLALAANAGISISDGSLVGADEVVTLSAGTGMTVAQIESNRHIANYRTFVVPESVASRIKDVLRGQFVVAATGADGIVTRASGIQIGPVLDTVYPSAKDTALGVTWAGGVPTIRVWAPTARTVALVRYTGPATSDPTIEPMTRDTATGVWSITGSSAWANQYFTFRVEVFAPSEGRLLVNDVTDPYAVSLSMNSTRSQIVDLTASDAKPAGWDSLRKPSGMFKAIKDATVYELMIRDFSSADETQPEQLRGTYGAFGTNEADGVKHLRALAKAGMTHLQLGPTFDFATTNEDRTTWQTPGDLTKLAPNSEEQQARVAAIKNLDGFNWGYDPLHYTAPEGSFASNPDGLARVKDMRSMIANINGMGLRVVVDVVYNHTNASGQSPKSIFDRIVPGYYHRLNTDGTVANSTCCPNTASERLMMAKLIRDSVLTWAVDHKVDGFRFDLMGHHQVDLMRTLRADLNALTVAKNGVDGRLILLYGEGWNFGEVKDNARFDNATQPNLAGTGVGTFDDRLRDAVRGGGPFDSNPRRQGFGSGLLTSSNGDAINGSASLQREVSNNYLDLVKLGLVGQVSTFRLLASNDLKVPASTILYNDSEPAAYTKNPTEQIAYVDAHDNETLFDALAFKLPVTTTMNDRVRHQIVALAVPTLSQGIPFYLAGTDLLRSKSLDKNSYDSGDWFNSIDWSKKTNGWGRGLPLRGDNADRWPYATTLLANSALQPKPSDIEASAVRFQEYLRIRQSSSLFRLGSATEVRKRVEFLTGGSTQQPGLVVMRILDEGKGRTNLDRKYKSVTVVFNAGTKATQVRVPSLAKSKVDLHPVLKSSKDPVVRKAKAAKGTLSVPALTVAVFVER
jgi:pullulanase-type alpha-1,6-glucosidase